MMADSKKDQHEDQRSRLEYTQQLNRLRSILPPIGDNRVAIDWIWSVDQSLVGIVTLQQADYTYGWIVLRRDAEDEFHKIIAGTDLQSFESARAELVRFIKA